MRADYREHRVRVGCFGEVMGSLTRGVILSHWIDFHGAFLAVTGVERKACSVGCICIKIWQLPSFTDILCNYIYFGQFFSKTETLEWLTV